MRFGKTLMMVFLALAAFANAFLLFARPEWFNPFVGMLFAVTLPFAGAMTAMFGLRHEAS